MPGTLFVVATPIGNLEDLTFRALRILREVDVIAAEDTRRTGKLLAHYGISRPMISFHEHNQMRETPRVVARISAGESVALVTDAGTPGISDPGAPLVHAAREAGIAVVPIPGASAVVTALSASGVSGDGFSFLGFPPATGAARERWFQSLKDEPRPVVFFEAPHRIDRSISKIRKIYPYRPIYLFRELTKVHEEQIFIGCKTDKTSIVREIGEFTVVLGSNEAQMVNDRNIPDAVVAELFCRLTDLAGVPDADAFWMVANHFNLNERDTRKGIKKGRILLKRAAEGISRQS